MQTLTPEETEVYNVKYASPIISKMQPVQILQAVRISLYKINVVTGWKLPDDEDYLNVLIEEFCKKLTQQYKNLNFDEIQYSIRTYGTQIKDWGKSINLSLIDEAITIYLDERRRVSIIEEQKKQLPPAAAQPLTDADYLEWVTDTETMYNKGVLSVALLPVPIYDYLDRSGILKLDIETKRIYYKAAFQTYAIAENEQRPHLSKILAKQIALSKYFDAKRLKTA
jgi:hypothetical protein